MATGKTSTLTSRIGPALKEALRSASEREYRSIAHLVEAITREHRNRCGRRLKGTAIEISNDTNTSATRIAAKEFPEITYPTHDLMKGIEAVGPNHGRLAVVIGEHSLAKSHFMAALYHTVNDATSTGVWVTQVIKIDHMPLPNPL